MVDIKVKKTECARQFVIDGIPCSVDDWDNEYFSVSGYFGEYGPYMFAAAPKMYEALKVCLKAEKERRKNLKHGSPASTYTDIRIALIERAISDAEAG